MNAPDSAAQESRLQTVGDWIRRAASRFNEAGLFFGHGTTNAADEARALVFHVLALDFDSPEYFFDSRLTLDECQRIAAMIERRVTERRPLPYLTNEAWFCGLSFFVDGRVLIPRSPIAELIEQGFAPWLDERDGLRVLDMCTGSGSIAVACALYLDDARVDAVDIDGAALDVARINIEKHAVGDRVRLRRSDLFAGLDDESYDLIVCNPPYVSAASVDALPDEYGHEPRKALLAGDNGLEFIARLVDAARRFLTPDGVLVVEAGESAVAFAEAWPDLPVTWCELSRGGDGVFVIGASQLQGALADDGRSDQEPVNRVG